MSFRLVPKSVTLNDLERRNGHYFTLYHQIRQLRGTLRIEVYVYDVVVKKVHVRYLIS